MIIHKEDQTELLIQRLSLKSSSLNPYIPTKRDRLHESSLSIPLGLMQSPLLSYIILRLYLSSITRFLSPPFFFEIVYPILSYYMTVPSQVVFSHFIFNVCPQILLVSLVLIRSFDFLPLIHLSIVTLATFILYSFLKLNI